MASRRRQIVVCSLNLPRDRPPPPTQVSTCVAGNLLNYLKCESDMLLMSILNCQHFLFGTGLEHIGKVRQIHYISNLPLRLRYPS